MVSGRGRGVGFVLLAGALAWGLGAPPAWADLARAAAGGDVAAVRAALDAGESPDPADDEDVGPLHTAVLFGHEAVVVLLLERGASVARGDDVVDIAAGAEGGAYLGILRRLLDAKASPNRGRGGGWRPLHTAASKGRDDAIRLLLKHGASLEAPTQTGQTPLAVAAAYDKPAAVAALLEAGAKVETRDAYAATPLHSAAWWGFREVARLLRERGAPLDVFTAAGVGDAEALERLLAGGAAVDAPAKGGVWDGCTALAWAAHAGQHEALALLLSRGANPASATRGKTTPLHFAAMGGSAAVATRLLDAGAAVDAAETSGRTPLHYAARRGRQEVASVLLGAGADPNAYGGSEKMGSPRHTPLHEAAVEGHAELVRLLLAKGASPAAKTESGQTPLHVGLRHPEVVRALLAGGATPDLPDHDGATALHAAAAEAYLESARLLLEAGADAAAKDGRGRTPLHRACGKDLLDIFFGGSGDAPREPTPEEKERETRRIALAEALLARGADPAAKDGSGKTPIDVARDARHARLVAFLESRPR